MTLQYKFGMMLILVDSFHEICINVVLTKAPVPLPAIPCVFELSLCLVQLQVLENVPLST